MTLDIGMVTIDCEDPKGLAEFWKAALNREVGFAYENEFITLEAPAAGGVVLGLQRVPEPRQGKNRIHIDLGTEDRRAEVDRLVALGAKELDTHEMPGMMWTVLSDPEGNQFCVGAQH
jgi:predicted enzyme related to lactoylglutathione lyase